MNRNRWIIAAFFAVIVIASIWGLSDPERAARVAQARRDAALSAETKDIVLGLIAIAIVGYLGWWYVNRPKE